ncbi:hypothetical protein Vadar_003482 [Vaccinium darrowii]|uniref:Uncharacterized protein n=1 Tax=Vaccinium darrowii TaxID=229202 RepID=A0ACB7XX51_9ERIC|nr:hypothetical protein Vadar_003482 [Vaccinium darrowii]
MVVVRRWWGNQDFGALLDNVKKTWEGRRLNSHQYHRRNGFPKRTLKSTNVEPLNPDLEHLLLRTKQGLVSEAPIQRLGLSFTGAKLWQLRDRKEDPSGEIQVQWKSGLQNGVSIEFLSAPSVEHVQNVRDKLVLAPFSLYSVPVPRSLTNDTIPWRQRGHGIEPGGPWAQVEELLVEQRYRDNLCRTRDRNLKSKASFVVTWFIYLQLHLTLTFCFQTIFVFYLHESNFNA